MVLDYLVADNSPDSLRQILLRAGCIPKVG